MFCGYLKADTEVVVTIGPFVDVGDGFTPQTDITLGGDEAELIKHGSTAVVDISGATWAAVTGCRGYYSLTLTTAMLDTEGMITVIVQDDSDCLPVHATFEVVNANVYDSLYAAATTDYLQVDTIQITGTSQTANDVGADVNEILTDTGTTLQGELDAIEAAVITNAAGTDIAADIIAIKAETAAILEDTGTTLSGQITTIATDTTTDIPALIAALPTDADVNAQCDTAISDAALATATNLATVDTVVDAIKVITDALTAAAAAKLATSAGTIVSGTVAATASSTTVIYSDDVTEATADHYNGRVIIFTSGVLTNQATSISDYELATGEGKFTVVAMTEAPSEDDTFIIV